MTVIAPEGAADSTGGVIITDVTGDGQPDGGDTSGSDGSDTSDSGDGLNTTVSTTSMDGIDTETAAILVVGALLVGVVFRG